MARLIGYASLPDVALKTVQVATYTASSKPTATQVHNMILDVSDELDAKLAALEYDTPVATGATQAFDLLNAWTSIGAAMYAMAGTPQGEKSNHLGFLERRWSTILTALEQGTIQIPGLSKSSTTGVVRFGAGGASGGSPYFTRDYIEI